MKIDYIPINDLKPYERNAKKHSQAQIDQVATSIQQFGFVQPIVISCDNNVIIGHCRLLAAKKLEMKSVPCLRAEDLTDEEIKALRLIDNKTNESPWDNDLLKLELLDLPDLDLDFWGFDLSDINIDDFFVESDNVEQKKDNMIQCPHCGEFFEPK